MRRISRLAVTATSDAARWFIEEIHSTTVERVVLNAIQTCEDVVGDGATYQHRIIDSGIEISPCRCSRSREVSGDLLRSHCARPLKVRSPLSLGSSGGLLREHAADCGLVSQRTRSSQPDQHAESDEKPSPHPPQIAGYPTAVPANTYRHLYDGRRGGSTALVAGSAVRPLPYSTVFRIAPRLGCARRHLEPVGHFSGSA